MNIKSETQKLASSEDHTVSRPTAPPAWIVERAVANAQQSPCAKSRRGVTIYEILRQARSLGLNILGDGFNGPPPPFRCSADLACRAHCRELCEHAEIRAIHDWLIHREVMPGTEVSLVHAKIDTEGKLVAGGEPSCHQCSRTILDIGLIHYVWLYVARSTDLCPHVDLQVNLCTYCQHKDCLTCHVAEADPATCHHNKQDRHGNLPNLAAGWRRYNVQAFHEYSLAAKALTLLRT